MSWNDDEDELAEMDAALIRELLDALRPFATFAKKWDDQPINGIDDRLYGIHSGTPWEAELRLSECRHAKAVSDRVEAILTARVRD